MPRDVGDRSGNNQLWDVMEKIRDMQKELDSMYDELKNLRSNRGIMDDAIVEHDPTKTDCTKFLVTIEDGEVIAYDGCHGDDQGVAHAATLYGASPFKTNNGGQRHVMVSIDEVPEDEEGMSENEKAAQRMFESVASKTGDCGC